MKAVNGQSINATPDLSRRTSGVLLHVSSLPGNYGIGDLGPAAEQWIDMLSVAKQRWWQILPLGPCGEGNSPYRSYSAFAGNPLLISPDRLVQDGLLQKSDLRSAALPGNKVDYAKVTSNKTRLLEVAFVRFSQGTSHKLSAKFGRFVAGERAWLNDFALFMALRLEDPQKSWTQWPLSLLRRQAEAMRDVTARLSQAIRFQKFIQFIFFRQLQSLRDYAKAAGVALIGDLPIFVSPESADVWTNPRLFQLDRNMRPTAVSGVPPDLFSSTGQRWGNPLYNWKEMAKDNFAWWKSRLAAALRQADLVRIDHFRGFESYWKIPATAPTAETGKWVKAPGAELFKELLRDNSKLPLVAEDLGVITPQVEALRDHFQLPGMRVLQFGFGAESGNPHTPHNFIHHCFAYTGTHDNDTTAGWYASLSAADRSRLMKYAPGLDWKNNPAWALVHLLSASAAGHAITTLQDLLGLDGSARMNIPGQSVGNWEWRLRSFTDCKAPLARLTEMTKTYDRQHLID